MKSFFKKISFTKSEINVIIFAVSVIAAGFTIKYFRQITGGTEYVYSLTDKDSLKVIKSDNTNKNDTSVKSEQGLNKKPDGSKENLLDSQVTKKSKKELNLAGQSININTAGKEDLIKLPGVGETTAEKIILFRETHGIFETIEDIMKVKGIGKKKFAKMKPYICTE